MISLSAMEPQDDKVDLNPEGRASGAHLRCSNSLNHIIFFTNFVTLVDPASLY